MIWLIRKFVWVLLGAAGVLAADRWLGRQRVRFTPRAMTSSLLDTINQGLEQHSGTSSKLP